MIDDSYIYICFNPLWINTALKLLSAMGNDPSSFNPLWINTVVLEYK